MRPLCCQMLRFLAVLVTFATATLSPQSAPAQPGSRIVLRPEPGWPALQILSPREGARYTGSAARKVPVQVYIHRGQLSRQGFRLSVTVDGRRYMVTDERPFYLENLARGSHEIRFELLDYRGEVVPGGTSVQNRSFHIGPRESRSHSSSLSPTSPRRDTSPRTYAAPDPAIMTGTPDARGFTARPGGRREGPVPQLDAPEARRSQETPERFSRSSEESVPTRVESSNPVRPVATSTPFPGADFVAPAGTPDSTSRDQNKPDTRNPSQTTVSATMRRSLLETGRRLTESNTRDSDDQPLIQVRGTKPTTGTATRGTVGRAEKTTSPTLTPDGN